ncbi:MAG TPA: polysaccharide deacetylase family protein [Gemmatimonas sp.]|nr:polysaccharide deacetylase family protein [Gemmatimonas sp.]
MNKVFERVRRAPVWLRNRALQPAAILCYHRVTSLEWDPHRLALSPAQFEEHLIALREIGTPTTLESLATAVRDGRWIRNAIVVTFDDGYADNLYEAKPLLEKYEVPATVFVTTGQIGAEREFWWDALERLLLGAHALPESLLLPVGEGAQRWMIPDEARLPGDEPAPALQATARVVLRTSVLQDIRNALLDMHPNAITRAVDSLHAQVGISTIRRDSHRSCTAPELLKLAGERPGESLIDIGAHTVTHPRLSLLDTGEQMDELHGSRLALESILGRPVTTAAYPFGRSSDVNQGTASAARAAGIDVACTLSPGPLCGTRTDPLMLPRFAVHPMDGDALSRWLRYTALG